MPSARDGAAAARAATARRGAGCTLARRTTARPALLHVDRVFTIRGAGTVVTGTLWSGVDRPRRRAAAAAARARARVREVQVHDERVERAAAGQRVAVNLRDAAPGARGDVLSAGADWRRRTSSTSSSTTRIDHGTRVHVHHGTRESARPRAWLGGHFHQLRCETPLIARRDDRLVIRSIAPPTRSAAAASSTRTPAATARPRELTVHLTRLARGESPAQLESVP